MAAGWVEVVSASGKPLSRLAFQDLGAVLASAQVGLRVMISGPEHLVLAASASCREAGMLDEEQVLHATSSRERQVWCAHCKAVTLAAAGWCPCRLRAARSRR